MLVADIFEAAGAFRRVGDEIASAVGQTQARWQTLSVLSSEPPLTVPQAARRLGISRQATQRVVNELVADGALEALANQNHLTSPLFVPTTAGRRALERISARAEQLHARLAPRLTETELETTRRTLQALSAALRED